MLHRLDSGAKRVDRVAIVHRHRLGDDHRARVDALVDVVDGRSRQPTPAASTSSIGCAPKSSSGAVRVHAIRPAERSMNGLRSGCM